MKIAFYTLGCKVNQYETQGLKEKFIEKGHQIVGEQDFADVYIINTCTVTGLADRKSRQYIRRMKRINPDSVTAVIGCFAQVSPDEAGAIEGVNIVAGANEKNHVLELVEEFLKKKRASEEGNPAGADGGRQDEAKEYSGQIRKVRAYEELSEYESAGIITSMESRTRAFIKIQEGCNRFCSYCVIPYARGMVRSRPKDEIVREAETLIGKGFKELVLTGINTALYGMEDGFEDGHVQVVEPDGTKRTLYGIELVVKALNDLPGEFRIRLGSLEPTVVNAGYVGHLLRYEKLCPHFHLSIQSGSDRVITAMNRNYTRDEYLDMVRVLKRFDSGFGISTDIIVGFPGETEGDFRDSVRMTEEAGFCKVHVFKYSRRPMTKAAQMKGHLAPEVKARRSAELIQAAERAAQGFFAANKGLVRSVLFEEYDEASGYYRGHADNFIEVYAKSSEDISNTFQKVKLMSVYGNGMMGNLR